MCAFVCDHTRLQKSRSRVGHFPKERSVSDILETEGRGKTRARNKSTRENTCFSLGEMSVSDMCFEEMSVSAMTPLDITMTCLTTHRHW